MVKTLNIFFKYEFYIRKRKRINITKNLKKKKKYLDDFYYDDYNIFFF